MGGDVAIRANGLGKKYLIAHELARSASVSLRETLAQTVNEGWRRAVAAVRRDTRLGRRSTETFWALQDVGFEVRRGEVLGIIGRNGAGKSTLLKILSRITEPTCGRVAVNGRVASLLEVGTGFHPELTGRENIFLNGAILGMRRSEIRAKFDQIVAFAEVEKFIDTPVKRYSSGMYVRLAFAVAAHLEPEILVVDEVLSVGDAEFQKRCLGKMEEVSRREGRTVLFVSHNMAAVNAFCSRAIWLAGGRKVYEGTPHDTIGKYHTEILNGAGSSGRLPVSRNGLTIRSCRASVVRDGGSGRAALSIEVEIEGDHPNARLGVGLALKTPFGVRVAEVSPRMTGYLIPNPTNGLIARFLGRDVDQYLNGGEYLVDVWIAIPRVQPLVYVEAAASFSMHGQDLYRTGHEFTQEFAGIVPLKFDYDCSTLPKKTSIDSN